MGDFSLTTFSSKGQLTQVENALEAVRKGETAIGIKAKDGVVLAVEKKLTSILVDEESYNKVLNFAQHIGATYAGLGTDFRTLCQEGRKKSMEYALEYGESMYVNSLCRDVATTVQEYTISGGVRPFGISMLVAGFDDDGPHLYQVDPSGAYYGWKATAIGKNQKNAKTFLEKRYNVDISIEDAIHTALLTLKEGYEGQMNSHNIEIGVVRSDRLFKRLTPEEVKDYLKTIE